MSAERKELLSILRVMWRNGDSSLRRIYPSWEDLEANLEIQLGKDTSAKTHVRQSCPICGVTQEVTKPLDELFPYGTCQSCHQTFHISNDLSVRELTGEEKENLPAEWIRVLEDLQKRRLAIVFKLE